MGPSLESLQARYALFVEDRDWDQYHTPQNLSMAISIESNELLENFLWFNNPSSAEVSNHDELMGDVEDELADVLIYSMGLAYQLDIDLLETVEQKLDENEERFDAETSAEISKRLEEFHD